MEAAISQLALTYNVLKSVTAQSACQCLQKDVIRYRLSPTTRYILGRGGLTGATGQANADIQPCAMEVDVKAHDTQTKQENECGQLNSARLNSACGKRLYSDTITGSQVGAQAHETHTKKENGCGQLNSGRFKSACGNKLYSNIIAGCKVSTQAHNTQNKQENGQLSSARLNSARGNKLCSNIIAKYRSVECCAKNVRKQFQARGLRPQIRS